MPWKMLVAWAPFSGDITGRTAAIRPRPIKARLATNKTTSTPSRLAPFTNTWMKSTSPTRMTMVRTTLKRMAKSETPERWMSLETGAMKVYSSVPSQRS